MESVKLPADYAIDALALETDRRREKLGRAYSYGQLIADTTQTQREQIAEDYRKQMEQAGRQGRYRVKGGSYMTQEKKLQDAEDDACRKFEALADTERAGE